MNRITCPAPILGPFYFSCGKRFRVISLVQSPIEVPAHECNLLHLVIACLVDTVTILFMHDDYWMSCSAVIAVSCLVILKHTTVVLIN